MKKRIVCACLIVVLICGLSVSAMALGANAWKEAYTGALKEMDSEFGCGLQLVDLNLDGTPELLVGSHPGSGLFSTILKAYSYQNGALKELKVEEGRILSSDPQPYRLYRNKESGVQRIEGNYTVRAGYGNYVNVIAYYAVQGDSLTVTNAFTKEESLENGVSSFSYQVDGKQVSEAAYKQAVGSRNDGWELVPGFICKEHWTNETLKEADVQTLLDSYTSGPVLAQKSTHKVKVDGRDVAITGYNINGNNYFKLRDVAMMLGGSDYPFELSWSHAEKRITLTTGKAYTPVGGELAGVDSLPRIGLVTDAALYADGVLKSPTAYNIGGNNYYKLRDVADMVGFSLLWDAENNTVIVTAKKPA